MPLHLPRKVIPLGPMKLALADVTTIYQRLSRQVSEQGDSEIAALRKPENQTETEFDTYKSNARAQAFKITVTIAGRAGESLIGDDESIFNSPNRPDKIGSIYMTNVTAYQGFSARLPLNAFELNLDFSKPPLLDINNPVSAPTQNFSNLTVQGDRDSWVAAISDAVSGITNARVTRRAWLHRAFAYDVGMMLLAFPFALYLCWKAGTFISKTFQPLHYLVSGAAYIYLFLVTLWAYRILFGYTKWAFPAVELSDNRDAAIQHRAVWGAIVLTLISDVIWEMFR